MKTQSIRNIEIKAKLDYDLYGALMIPCEIDNLSLTHKMLKQKDIFFNTKKGKLKVRIEGDKKELIYYVRDEYMNSLIRKIQMVDDGLIDVLTMSNGVYGTIEKTRHFYTYENTRIHIDDIEGFDDMYIEFEYVCSDEYPPEKAESTLRKLCEIFKVKAKNETQESYIDMLKK